MNEYEIKIAHSNKLVVRIRKYKNRISAIRMGRKEKLKISPFAVLNISEKVKGKWNLFLTEN